MYGTVARMQVLPGKVDELRRLMEGPAMRDRRVAGYLGSAVYRTDADEHELWLTVWFDSKESYHANAGDPAQDVQYRAMRALLAADPEWHDGEIIDWMPPAGA